MTTRRGSLKLAQCLREWIKVIEQAIKEYISASSFKKEQHSLCNEDKKEIQGRLGNDFCADCNATSE